MNKLKALMRQRRFSNPIARDEATFLKFADETGGTYTSLSSLVLPGGGSPMHYHKSYTETFTPMEGTLGLQLGDESVLLRPGESIAVPAGVPHRCFNPGETAVRFLTRIEPGHAGFEHTVRIVFGLARDGECNRNGVPRRLLHVALLMVMSDSRLPGVLRLVMPLVRCLAAQAHRSGEHRRLLQRYCAD